VKVTGFVPNFVATELIGSMTVRCPNGKSDDKSYKQMRGGDGVAIPADNEVCTRTGQCTDLQMHDETCEFKVITWNLEGCNHNVLETI
jgi:hypothetical protein